VQDPRGRSVASRLLTVVVFVVLAGVAVTGFVATRNSADEEEQHVLGERASEVAAILSTSASLSSSLRLVGEVYVGSGGNPDAFTAGAASLVIGAVTEVGVAELVDDEVVVRAIVGADVMAGDVLDDERGELVRRTVGVTDLTSTLIRGDAFSTVVVAIGRTDGLVVWQQSLIANEPVPQSPGSPFEELDAALYRTPTADPTQLLIATTDDLPLSEPLDSRELTFGSERWLLQTSARSSLISAQARALPWIVLGTGLAAALLATGLVELLARRRAYAMALVDQRTADLRHAMADLEAARGVADTANKAKSQFLSRMSHELRTPLNSVLGFAQLLEIGELDADDRDAVEHILKGGTHLLDLINEVLDISRIESGDLALSIESVLARDVVAESIDLIRPLANGRGIHLVDRTATCVEYVFADRQRLKQVMLNLLSNAVKYNRLGGTITVACEHTTATRLRLTVADTGLGIAPDDLGLLFVPFERLGADLTEIEGSGIGLALSRRLADAMGGTLDLVSTVGSGSTFWIELPRVEGAVERYERLGSGVPAEPQAASTEVRHAVLYIEDNLANVTLVQRIMAQRNDIELLPAMQGRLGVDLARQHRPALILMDLHLPDITGEEVLQQLRDDPVTRSIPVVVVSADATTGQMQRLQSAGATAYLTKPFNVRELLDTVTQLVGSGVVDPIP
jgi:signal transduction histidine kinase/ActR/RegA family two-component response regulator